MTREEKKGLKQLEKAVTLSPEEWEVVTRGLNYSIEKLIMIACQHLEKDDPQGFRMYYDNAKRTEALMEKIKKSVN